MYNCESSLLYLLLGFHIYNIASKVSKRYDSDSSDEGPKRVAPVPSAGRHAKPPSPAGNKRGALNLDWLSNLESEMGQLQGQMEKMSPHIRGGGLGNQSPAVRGDSRGTPGSAGNGLQFVRKNDRGRASGADSPGWAAPVETPPTAADKPSARGAVGSNSAAKVSFCIIQISGYKIMEF